MSEYYSDRYNSVVLPAAQKLQWHFFSISSAGFDILLVPEKETLGRGSSLSLLPFVKWIHSTWLKRVNSAEAVELEL